MSDNVLTDAEIEVAFEGANFGHANYRSLLASSLLKTLVGYHCGHTITTIMTNMRLIGKTGLVTKKGKRIVAQAFNDQMICGG